MDASAVIDNSPAVLTDLVELLDRDPATEDRAGLRDLVAAERRVRAWLDAFGVKVARRTRQLADQERPNGQPAGANTVIASLLDAGCTSGKDAKATATREGVCADLPGFEDALASGEVSGAHLDALGYAAKNLTDAERLDLRARTDELLGHAREQYAETFEKTAKSIVDEIRGQHRPGAGADELQAQRKASKVTEWVDRTTGMHKTLLELDPVRAASLKLAISSNLSRLRRQPGNARRPFDELKVEAFLLAVTNPADGPAPGRVPEVIVLIDWATLRNGVRAAGGVCELSDGTPLPVATVRQMACDADLLPVVLGGQGEVLDVGRARRLATAAQRTALRAMYATCAEPGCDIPFDDCSVHHIDPWASGGRSDLANLLPVCTGAHTRLHEDGWKVLIGGDHAAMTWVRPDGTIAYRGRAGNRHPRSDCGGEPADPPTD